MTNIQPATPSIGLVNANPSKDQTEALIRQVLTLAGGAGLLAFLPANVREYLVSAPGVSLLATVAGLAAIVYGQIKTRTLASKAAQMANALPDSVAATK